MFKKWNMSFIIVYTTYANEVSAKKLSNFLIENKYAACANIFPIKSAYWWNAAIASENEYVAILKTIPENWEALQAKIEEIHPYEVPCIMKIDASANQTYEDWIRSSVEVKTN